MMGQALGIPDSGLLVQRESTQLVDPNEPLDKLLLNRRFRQSFMEFADRCQIVACYSITLLFFLLVFICSLCDDIKVLCISLCSCLAGESVHFYEEVQQLDKIPVGDHVRRIYMARHIIDMYITPGTVLVLYITCLSESTILHLDFQEQIFSFYINTAYCLVYPFLLTFVFSQFSYTGATMEVNISHHCRQEILSTLDLAHPNLFKNALNELIQLMNMVSLFS